ncbi:4a-hydroxytetrahydrobiopterin dehydratase [Silanimonas sp.]|jgi:4a-hydroxytetrahydrobiopterin dehydratase|uniref:4a-hydroxytetrahydrobiopterin dehydratase n=1 Tax=Silanimonas sp. TaxID=1929290 RepID=UPI0022CA194A|nr:4a-hydroxytetrahydrobiopterin dehydratase [Silanimonas sp.]MCZ8113515.1 4a-hydroxytetrahydrobiopterin dehydratase [Silanimonas sp.]
MTTLSELATAHCTPLRGAEHQLSPERVAALLAVLPAGWRLIDDGPAIEKTFRFADYHRTMAYVNALAFIAHAEDHHPDLGVHYDRCVVRFSTHDVGGLSINDFVCAAKAEALLQR